MSIIETLAVLPTIDNPLGGIVPDFTIFGIEFDALWKKIMAGFWAGAIILAIFFLIGGVTSMATASASGSAMEYKDARTKAMWGGISLGLLAALGVIVGAILALFG